MRHLLPLLSLLSVTQALYFYLDGTEPRCVYEDLPKDTLVVGHYTAEEYDDNLHRWQQHAGIEIYISVVVRLLLPPPPSPPLLSIPLRLPIVLPSSSSLSLPDVQETFNNDHRVVAQRGSSSGRFTFTSQEAGSHKICFTPNSSSGRSAWILSSEPNGGIKLKLDLVIGDTNQIESSDKEKLQDIASRVKDLNARLNDIRREQIFQRVSPLYAKPWPPPSCPSSLSDAKPTFQEREAEFRDQSESTNSRVIRWIIIQLVIIGITCAWQLSHLRSFFIKQKLT